MEIWEMDAEQLKIKNNEILQEIEEVYCSIGKIILCYKDYTNIPEVEDFRERLCSLNSMKDIIDTILNNGENSVCPYCEKANRPNARFCDQCGKELTMKEKLEEKVLEKNEMVEETHTRCAACGTILSSEANFCKECGLRIS